MHNVSSGIRDKIIECFYGLHGYIEPGQWDNLEQRKPKVREIKNSHSRVITLKSVNTVL